MIQMDSDIASMIVVREQCITRSGRPARDHASCGTRPTMIRPPTICNFPAYQFPHALHGSRPKVADRHVLLRH